MKRDKVSIRNKKVYVRKNSGTKNEKLYKWKPEDSLVKPKDREREGAFFCTTPLGGQGNDLIVTYVYEPVIINAKLVRYAYVQCDYVQ